MSCVAADCVVIGLTATLTPTSPLADATTYNGQATYGIQDLEGQGLSYFFTSFTTR